MNGVVGEVTDWLSSFLQLAIDPVTSRSRSERVSDGAIWRRANVGLAISLLVPPN